MADYNVIVAATAAVGEWKLFLETLDENKRDVNTSQKKET
jgi:hypothetical protein